MRCTPTRGRVTSARRLAEEACHIELERLKEPIGKQDQYIAAYGGLQFMQFCNPGRNGVCRSGHLPAGNQGRVKPALDDVLYGNDSQS